MKKILSVLGVLALLGWTTVAAAQTQPMAPHQAPGQASPSPKPAAQRPPRSQMGDQGMMMGPGMMEQHQRMMETMCPMMMGMMKLLNGARSAAMGNSADPKAMARMLRLRSDMMKAMSEVLLKHAQELEQEK